MNEILARIWERLGGRVGGPMSFRLLLRPAVAAVLSIRAGIQDARTGRPPYFWTMLSNPADRRDLLREGRKAVATVFVMAVVIDAAWAQTSGLAEVRSIVDLANAKIETLSQGKGDVVVLLPGGSLSLDYLANLARSLETSGYRAVRINPRGAGASTGAAEGVTLHTLADDVAGVIEQLDGGPVWVAGHAFGNRVARMLASDHPELVKGVILLAAGGKVAPTPDAGKALDRIFDPRTSEADYLDAMQYMVGDPADRALAGEALKQSRAPNAGPIQRTAAMSTKLTDWWAPGVRVPFLILQGANDQASPPQNGEMLKADLGDRATLVDIPAAGHLMVVTKPDVVSNEIVQFIRQHAK